jgi:hypothetical protein
MVMKTRTTEPQKFRTSESRETGNIRTSEQQKKEKPKPEWFEHPKLRSSAKQENEKLGIADLLNL